MTGVTNKKITQESVKRAGEASGHVVIEKVMSNSIVISLLKMGLLPLKTFSSLQALIPLFL